MGQKGRKTALPKKPAGAEQSAGKKETILNRLPWSAVLTVWACLLLALGAAICLLTWGNTGKEPGAAGEKMEVTAYEDERALLRAAGADSWEEIRLESTQVEIRCLRGEKLFLNGKALRQEDLAQVKAPRDLNGPERRSEDGPRIAVYKIGPLYGEIRVTDREGRELSPLPGSKKGTLVYEDLPGERWDLDLDAREDVSITVNGEMLRSEDIDSIGDGWVRYRLRGFYREPVLSARCADGTAAALERDRFGLWRAYGPGSAEDDPDLRQAAAAFFESWLAYHSRPADAGAYYTLLSRICPDAPLYAQVRESLDAMYWVPVTERNDQRLDYSCFEREDETHFSCLVHWDAVLLSQYWTGPESSRIEKCYRLGFRLERDAWRLESLEDWT